MAKEKKVEQITDMEVDFAQWYTDVCKKAELIDYSSIKGMFIYRPYGYAIWENIQRELDRKFKETGHENVMMPMLIPESLLQKEKDHVEGFAPECAWVTYGGGEKLEERYCIRPTSETLFCEHFKNVIQSHRDLPKKYNQWCSVLRWEKTSRPFLRHREFLWQEGHTMHVDEDNAREETMRMLNVYADFMENVLAMPVIRGRKTDKEKFNGAEETYTVECMMHDKKALQAGTSHYFGDGFAKAFDITFAGKDNLLHNPHQTSWGVSTRMIGGIIMTHGDNNGLVLPPRIAPIQAMVIPVAQHKPGVLDAANDLLERLKANSITYITQPYLQLLRANPHFVGLGLLYGQQLAGECIISGRGDGTAELAAIYIAPEHQRRGLGKKLLQRALAISAHEGIKEVRARIMSASQPQVRLMRTFGAQLLDQTLLFPGIDL